VSARFIVGDVFDGLASLPDHSVDCVVTSPPFLALRSYLPPDHPDKGKEIGSEPTPAAFLDTMLALTAELRRVVAPHGSIFVELGDTYSGSGGAGGDYADEGLRDGQNAFTGSARAARGAGGWPLPKSLCFIPELYGASLSYGRNLLTGEESPAGSWLVRNKVAWVRPNPPVGALGDKVRPGWSMGVWACTSPRRWFDLDAVRVSPARDYGGQHNGGKYDPAVTGKGRNESRQDGGVSDFGSNPAGAPPLDWWKISPGGYEGSHYAVFPPELCRIPIEASCPRRVCRTCGEPSRREVDIEGHGEWRRPEVEHTKSNHGGPGTHGDRCRQATTTGWSSCGCPGTDGIRLDGYHTGTGWRPGVVLDPFAGSGTTLMVATGRSRDAIGLDLDERNADLALDRVGPLLLTVEHLNTEGAA
jgi:site-specific DNA-methyltransferase (adenine-specific)